MGGNNDFFFKFERNEYLKKLPSMQRVNTIFPQINAHSVVNIFFLINTTVRNVGALYMRHHLGKPHL